MDWNNRYSESLLGVERNGAGMVLVGRTVKYICDKITGRKLKRNKQEQNNHADQPEGVRKLAGTAKGEMIARLSGILTKHQRIVAVLYYADELNINEIASLLKTEPTNIHETITDIKLLVEKELSDKRNR